jgi:hypothetical protein
MSPVSPPYLGAQVPAAARAEMEAFKVRVRARVRV